MRNLRGQVALYSPAARGKLSSPQRGGQTINLSVHPSTETGQLQREHRVTNIILVYLEPRLPEPLSYLGVPGIVKKPKAQSQVQVHRARVEWHALRRWILGNEDTWNQSAYNDEVFIE